MKSLLASTSVLCASAVLFAIGVMSQSKSDTNLAAPTSLSVIVDHKLASGPTIPPGPWDEDDSGSGGTKIASGPTIPPGPWDEDDSDSGGTKLV
jgi:hypothetical protein